ncbi:hypothetical protein [Streptococcus pluranimalium]|uniref:hypothetical protein n=1 Tax=Streptococcus pluranimalium TaxID=82348 RepID=UPI003F67D26D
MVYKPLLAILATSTWDLSYLSYSSESSSLFLKGTLTFSLRDVLMPLVGMLSLGMIYDRADKARQLKQKR